MEKNPSPEHHLPAGIEKTADESLALGGLSEVLPYYEAPTIVDGGELTQVTLGPCTEGWGDANYGWRKG